MTVDLRQLLYELRPRLHYDGDEMFYADAAEVLVDNVYVDGPGSTYATRLMREEGDEVIAAADSEDPSRRLTLDFLRPGLYPTNDIPLKGDYLDSGLEWVADGRRGHRSEAHANRIYGRIAESRDGGSWLQYWFFYFASVKGIPSVRSATGPLGFGLHAGDWEMIQLHVPWGEAAPSRATYAAHDYAFKVESPAEEWEDGIPDVYVAVGSHASYPRPGKWRNLSVLGLEFLKKLDDRCMPQTTVRPELIVLDDVDEAWPSWPGRWGRPGPPSPARQDQWLEPDRLHEEAHKISKGLRPPALEESGTAPVKPVAVDVDRTGSRVTISFEVPFATDDAWGALLTIAVDPPDELLPTQWVYDVTAPGRHDPVGS